MADVIKNNKRQVIRVFRKVASNPILVALAIIGLIIRLYLATFPGFKYDIGSFFYWAVRLNDLPLNLFYSSEVFTDYTPGYLYILAFLGFLKNIFNFSDPQFAYVLKIPSILCEIIMGFLIYFIALKYKLSEKVSLVYASAVFLNPGLIFNSSIWGQADAVFTLPLVLSIFFLSIKKYSTAAVILAISFLIKPQTLAVFPVFALVAFKDFNLFVWSKFVLIFLAVLFILSFPFFPGNPLWLLANKVLKTAAEYPYTALGPYNFWGGVGYWINDLENHFYGLSYQTWGYIMLAGFWVITSIVYFKRGIPQFTLAALATMAFFFLPTRVHERYLYPALIFLIIAAIEFKSEIVLYIQGVFGLIYFLNLYRVYVYYNEDVIKSSPAFMIPTVYKFLAGQDKMISQLVTGLFVIFVFYLLTLSYRKNYVKKD